MRIKFCGAARKVTGSSHLITLDDGYQILLDCGLNQGNGADNWQLNNKWHFDPKEVDKLILSHAHIDHSGRVPQLVKDGFKGCIHSTHATRSLCAIMLMDSAKIQERDVEWHNKNLKKKRKRKNSKSKTPRRPLYTTKDVPKAVQLFESHPYEKWIRISDKVEILFRDAGHILGSANVTLRINEGGETKTIGFTGDIGRPNRPILKDPMTMPEVDYLICESTYGDKLHESSPAQTQKFMDCMQETCVEKGGKLIIPAFSVGRTQEIVHLFDQLENAGKLPKIPFYVDSPLAVNATKVFEMHPECFDQDLTEYILADPNPFGFNALNYIRSVDASKALNASEKPAVIISSSGMMTAGRIRHHMYHGLENPKNTFLIVGYCSPNSAGGILRAGATELKMFGEVLSVNASIETMDSLSAHADQEEMLEFISNQRQNLKKLFLVHGEYDTQQVFKTFLNGNGFNEVEIPDVGHEFELS